MNRTSPTDCQSSKAPLPSHFRACRWTSGVVVALAVLVGGGARVFSAESKAPKKPADLYQLKKVWTIHLTFTPEQWEAMEPAGGGPGFFRGPGGPGGPGRPGGFGGGPRGGGGGGGFGPGMFIAPAFLAQGDADRDGKLSRAEFESMAGRWFKTWDKDHHGRLNAEQLREGINTTFAPPAGGPGPGMRGPGRMLQGAEGQRNGLAGAAGIEFKYVHADLEFEGRTLKDVGVRYKGNGTWMQSQGSDKKSMKVEVNKYKDQELAGVKTFNLHSNVTDASEMNEPLSHRLYRDAGVPAPRTAYAKVYVTVPGKLDRKYLGLYSMVEDVDKTFVKQATKTKGGAILKPVTPELFADLGDDWARYKQTYDPKADMTEKQTRRVIDFCRLVTNADDAEFAAKVGDYLDLEEFARYMAVTTWLSTLDSILGMGQNFYVYLNPKTDKFEFIPWDLDHSFGQFPFGGTQEDRENLSILHPWRGEVRFLERVYKVEAFKTLYLARMKEFGGTIFKAERFEKQVDEVAAAIKPAIAEESPEKLTRFEQVAAGEAVSPAPFGGGPGGPRFMGMPPAKPIKAFVGPRAKSVEDQLAGRSEGAVLGDMFGRGRGGGPQAMAAGNFLGPAFMSALDTDKDGELTREEFVGGFQKWFEAWDVEKKGVLTDEQLRAGINKDLPIRPAFGGPPGGPPGAGPAPQP